MERSKDWYLRRMEHRSDHHYKSTAASERSGESAQRHGTRGGSGVSGPDPDRNISPTSLCSPEISGPDNDIIVWS